MTSAVNPTLRCPCDGRFRAQAFEYRSRPEGEVAFDLGGTAYHRAYDRCSACGHFFARHALHLNSLYAHDYIDRTYGGSDGIRRRYEKILSLAPERSDNAGRSARVHAFAQSIFGSRVRPWRLLDVGAGLGVFPATMKRLGWVAAAVEADERLVGHLEKVVGVTAWQQDVWQLQPGRTGLFEAVTLNKVLEHVEDPIAMLAQAASFAVADGFIYIEVPDAAAAEDGPGREEFFIEHYHVFSPVSLAAAIDRAGLDLQRLDRLREPSGKYTLFAFLRRRLPGAPGLTMP